VHKEEYDREDKENVNEEAGDVECDEGKGPYKYKQQSKSKKDEAHPSPLTFMLARFQKTPRAAHSIIRLALIGCGSPAPMAR
jgi:hypothetical protein